MTGVLDYRGMKKAREDELTERKNCGMFLLDGGDLLKQILSVKKISASLIFCATFTTYYL